MAPASHSLDTEMRHDPIDPGGSAGREHPYGAVLEAPFRKVGTRLAELERQSRVTLAATEEELSTLASREPGESENDATRVLAIGVLAEVLAREWKELGEIAAARGRLADGTFGRCEECGRDIGRSRLQAVPTARHCVACQTEMERRAMTWSPAA